MREIKILLQNKKIQAAVLILLVCVLFAAVLISSRSGQNNNAWNYKEASNSDAEQGTTIITEEVTREMDAEVETDASGKIFSILVEDETIDLTSEEIETEEKQDGSVTYKVNNDTDVVVNKDGTAKVIKKETVTKAVPVNTTKPNQINRPSNSTSSENLSQPSAENPEGTEPSSDEPPVSEPSSDESTSGDYSEEDTTEPPSTEGPEQTDTDADMEAVD